MRISSFESEICLPKGVDLIFPFFADARNLQVLTPPWLEFQMLTKGPILMHSGRLIDYRLRIRGIPLRWQTRIDVWDPPYRFVDSQLKGPYSFWRHEHLFVPERTGTRCIDQVQYAVPGGPWVGRLLVRPDLERIFDFRRKKLKQLFPSLPGRLGEAIWPIFRVAHSLRINSDMLVVRALEIGQMTDGGIPPTYDSMH
jgi:ligand-binding SRPBCC domain-containing protein